MIGELQQASRLAGARKVLFICKGSAHDGLGHVMRSRTVAQAMQAFGATRLVVIGDSYVDNLLAGHGLDYRIVKTEAEAVAICHEYAPQVVVFDLLRFTETHFREIVGTAMTVSLSPVFNLLGQVGLIFHRTRYLGEAWPRGEGAPITRCGLEYAVINQNCRKIPGGLYQRQLEFKELAVAISMGGTDAANKTLRVLNTIKQVTCPLLIWVILGEGYGHSYQELVDGMKGEPHEIILVKTNDSLWRILSACSLAILSGGTTAYEAAYAGLPAINLIESEKRAFLIQELVDKGVSICAGSNFYDGLALLDKLLSDFSQNRDKLLEMHVRSKKLIDGLGATRIGQEIQEHYLRG